MNGVTVLDTIQGNSLDYLFLILSVVSVIVFWVIFICKKDALMLFLLIVMAVICLVLAMPVNTRYKVTISNEVKFNEFNEKYEIIKKDGKIYTVEMRENDD